MSYRCIVYKLTFPDGKVYIGSTHSTKTRWANSGANYKGTAAGEAIVRFGWENVKKECLIELQPTVENQTACLAFERELIKAYEGRSYNVLGTETHDGARTAHLRKGFPKLFWTIDGETLSAAEWCRMYGKSLSFAMKRLAHNDITPKQALTLPDVPAGRRRSAMAYWKEIGAL